ncbi:heme/copper-type cytochrome/quinol oxidase, subunit 1 [Candidatus Nitrososphaera evergladensis SR1]|jgi:cytochrome c oxidase subunit 1|uniref:Heme/copper-type cytochrome/quinol oxidase, subunit 1 n=2 Tax=Nitrososphaera TaxID=497726 RepID=A0A075MPM1_9ARCH|nr:heme/copper-type cytochrome/quinol oxidase, subunit 1 [Candidatus Nitrososphaera evergladensis SR1]
MWEILFSTHHTDIGLLYIVFSITAVMIGGALAMGIRTELFLPGQQVFPDSTTFHRVFTTHGITMLFLWVLPFGAGVGNYLVPIMVRYKDMAWPKLNAIAFWMIPVAAGLIWLGFADTTWNLYPPYSTTKAPAPAADMLIFGLKILGLSSILGSINFIVTILKMKHPDLPLMKTSLFVWSIFTASLILLVSLPTFTTALIMLYTDRLGVTGFFDPTRGGDPIAYQHLFWFTFHPEVYVFVIPAIGMMYEIIPRFSRKPIFSYQSGVTAFVLLAIVSFASWGHHMFSTGESFTEKTVFMVGTLAAVPASAMHVFNWIATMWGGRVSFKSPMAYVVGGIVTFYLAGAGGVVNTAMPLDFITHDTYWVVGHMHLFLMGIITFAFIAFIYYLFPMMTGRMYNEKAAMIQFWLLFVGVSLTFITQHLMGLYGQPRRVFDYVPTEPLILMNQISTIGAWTIGTSMVLFIANLIHSAMKGRYADMNDPFQLGEVYYDYKRKEPHIEH